MKISQKFVDFNNESNGVVSYALTPENIIRFKIIVSQKDLLKSMLDDWNFKFPIYIDPLQHVAGSVIDINKAYDVFHPYLQSFKMQIKNDLTIELTGDDYTGLHIHEDNDRRHHIPRPTIEPENTVEDQTHLITKIFTFDPKHNTIKKLPEDVKKIGRKIAITPEFDAKPDPKAFINLEDVGTAVHAICFDESNEGSVCWLMTCYINPRGEEGPYCKPYGFRII